MYSISPQVRSSYDHEGAVILDIDHGKVLRLNKTASFIFKQLTHNPNESEIVRRVTEAFQVPRPIARTDVHEFLESLVRLRLVRREAPEVNA